MKKLFSLAIAAVSLFMVMLVATPQTAAAQSGFAYTYNTVAGDSLVTNDTVYRVITVSAGYPVLGVTVNIKKGTGTLDGKAYIFTSMDGSTYLRTDSATFTAVPSLPGIASTGYTHSAQFSKSVPIGVKYLVMATQSGSLTASPVQFQYTARKYSTQ